MSIFTLRLDNAGGEGVALEKAYPRERSRDWAERLGRAVESDVAELFGDGHRNPVPVELDWYVTDQVLGRVAQARYLRQIEAQLARTYALEFTPLSFRVLRARLITISPIEDGYKVLLRFYGPYHDFTDTDGSAVPLI